MFEHVVDRGSFPGIEDLAQQRPPILEVPVEAASGDADAFASGSIRTASGPPSASACMPARTQVARGVRMGAAIVYAQPYTTVWMEVGMVQTIATERRVNPSHKVREISVPADARSLSTFSRIDYEDGFMVNGDPLPGRRCERWARAVIEDTPAAVRVKLLCSWWALGLKVGSPWSAWRVLGWEILLEDFDYVLLGAGSRLGLSGQLLFKRESDAGSPRSRGWATRRRARSGEDG